MVDVTPAQPAQVLDASSSRFPHDALVQVEGATSRSHEGSKPGSMDGVGHCGTPDGVAPIVLDTTSCDPLAMAASPSMTVAATEHPLSPDVSLASNDRTSYFRAAILPGISPVSDVIFPEENEDTPDAEGLDKQADAQRSIAGLNARKASHPLKSQDEASGVETSLPASIRLPRAPHNLSAAAVDEHLRSALPSDLRGVLLAQELSRQLERAEIELRQLRSLQEARENSLIALLRETGSVSESLISRTLVRSNAEARETLGDKQSDNNGWKVTLSASNRDSVSERTPATRAPLADDLQDAMFENDFKETARSISPTMPVDIRASPHLRHTGSPSPGPLSAATLHERRGRQSSQSLSARLFGGFTPPNTSFLSPTSDSFRANALPPTSASSGEGSPAQVTVPPSAKKSWANSIRSVTSTSSHQSNRGLSSWAGSLWSWNKSGRSRYFSDDEEEDEGQSDEDATPIAASSFTQHPSRKSRLAAESDKDKTIKGRPRTLSKSSSNSASTKSCDTTAATSFSSHAVTQAQSVDEEHSTSLRKSPSATSTLTIEGTDKADKLSSARKEGPARVLLARRPSALHPDAALTTHSVIAPVTTTSSPRASLSGEKGSLPTSTSILQSLASLDRDVEPTALSHEVPSHYRAVSESATYISRSSSQAAAKEVFRAPTTVSSNVTEWTYRLLDSFRGSPVPAILATVSTPVSAEMNRTGSKSPSTSRSISPRIPQAQSKAALSPATVLNDSTAKHVRLSVSSASSQDATFGSLSSHEAEEAMPLASSETQKQKGYIASARGTIGRALGLSSSPSSKVGSGSSGTIKKTGSSKARSNSLKAVIEPALTVPATFTSFSSPATVVRPNAPGASAKDHHPRAPPVATPLEMGTIVAPEAKPPTLSNDLADQMKNGPLVDRFGFVYDIKVGMKLLKEYRRKQETTGQTVISLDPPADVNVEDLREAIGPSPSATPGIETAMNSAALHLADDETLKPASGDTRSTSDSQSNHGGSAIDSSTTPQVPSNQSIRRLLNQLGEMNESVEQSQKEAWDRFIKRRRKKAHKPPKDDEVAIAAKARKKRTTFVEAPLSTVNNSLEDDSIDDQFADNLVGVASMGADKQDDKIFRNLVRSGIPIAYRPSVWAEVSGAYEIREPGVYQDLLSRHAGESSPCLEQIDMDTHRTFPTNIFFAGSGPGVAKLRRVLIAYSWRDPSIGYCQGMNLLAALLLLVYPDEEDAFWMLASVLERTLPSDYYSSQLLVSQADQRVLQDLIQLALPELYDHLEDLGVDLPAITFGWFLSLFTDALPIQTLLRVWDVLLVYGPISLFKIAIAIFKIHSAEIFATDSASNFYVLLTNLTSHLYSADKLLKTAFEELKFIKRHDVESLRLKHVADIEQELAPRQTTPAPTPAPIPPSSSSIQSPPEHETSSESTPT